jgi:hypothetical protein
MGEYNSAMFRINFELKLCREKITDDEMLEKIFCTFHTLNFSPAVAISGAWF